MTWYPTIAYGAPGIPSPPLIPETPYPIVVPVIPPQPSTARWTIETIEQLQPPGDVRDGLAKLLLVLRPAIKGQSRSLDADEAQALAWLEGLAAGRRR